MELSRRKWPTLEVGPLETWRKRDIVEAFLKRSLAWRRAGAPPSPRVNEGRDAETQPHGSVTFLTGVDFVDDGSIGFAGETGGVSSTQAADGGFKTCRAPGLALFPSMIESILSR